MYHDESEMNHQVGELSEGILEEKEKQMALELMEKYNLGGQQQQSIRELSWDSQKEARPEAVGE